MRNALAMSFSLGLSFWTLLRSTKVKNSVCDYKLVLLIFVAFSISYAEACSRSSCDLDCGFFGKCKTTFEPEPMFGSGLYAVCKCEVDSGKVAGIVAAGGVFLIVSGLYGFRRKQKLAEQENIRLRMHISNEHAAL